MESRACRTQAKPDPNDSSNGVTCLRTLASTTMLLGIGGVVVYVSPHDPWSLALTVGSFVILILLYHCLHLFENTPPESPRRETLKRAVWSLSTILTAVFTYRVASIMPLVPAIIIWSMAGISMSGGFYLLFMYDDHGRADDYNHIVDDEKKPLKVEVGTP